jgi:peptide/nickel transport system permease protein
MRIVAGLIGDAGTLAAFVFCVVVCLLAVFGPLVAPQDPYDLSKLNIMDNRLPPGSVGFEGANYLLGTDGQGRDMISAMIYGLRTSLLVGVVTTLLAMLIGTTMGLLAAYKGGIVDTLIMRVVDLILGFPMMLLALVLLAVLGPGIDKVIFALVLVQWAFYARTVRGQALSEMNREYMEAARCLALGEFRIIFRHLLVNCLPPVIVVSTIKVAGAISAEATLSFLGLGVPITKPSLGLLIANGYRYLMSGSYWISIFPGILLMLTIFSINIVGDRLKEILNPRLQENKAVE